MNDLPKHYKSADAQVRNMSGIVFEDVEIEPYNGTSFNTTTNRKIQFRLPRTGILDPQKSYMLADYEIANSGAIYSAMSCFKKMKVWIGNVLAVDEDYFNWARHKEYDAYMSTDEQNSTSNKATGYGVSSLGASSSATLKLPLTDVKFWKRGFFSKKLPLYKLNQITIELEIDDDINRFTSGDADTLTINNCELKLHLIDGPSLRSEYGGEIKGSYLTHEKHFRNLPSSSTRINEIIPAHYNEVKFILVEQQLNSLVDLGVTASGPAYNFTGNHTLNSANNCEVIIDGEHFPKNPIETDDIVELEDNLRKCWAPNSTKLGDYVHNYADRTSEANMYIGVPLASELKSVSGQKLSNKSGSIVVKSDCNATAQTDLNIWVYYNKFYKITADGAFSIVE